MSALEILNLNVETEEKEILHDVTLDVEAGEVLTLLGPNGSGKSTLAHVVAGHPDYEVTNGSITFNDDDILAMVPEERARAGIFVAWQHPQTVAGVSLANFLRLAYESVHHTKITPADFRKLLQEKLNELHLAHDFAERSVNDGLSGGEKKKAEMLQLAVLEPRLVILDETDSGLDVDALRIVGQSLQTIRANQPAMSWLIITHHQRLLDHVSPDRVAILQDGRITKTTDPNILADITADGFSAV